MAFITIPCPRSIDPKKVEEKNPDPSVNLQPRLIKVASKKRAIRIMVNAQRELLKDRKASEHVPDLVNVVKERSVVDYTGLVCSTDRNGVRNYHAMPDRPASPELREVNFDATREVIAQRLIRHNKAAPQRKRRTK